MRRIIRIEGVEKKRSKLGKTYWRTFAVLDDGTEATGWGKDFDLQDSVEVFFHFNTVKMKKKG